MDKLQKILDQHGIIYKKQNDRFLCFCYAFSDDFDTLEVRAGKTYVNGERQNIFDWLGY